MNLLFDHSSLPWNMELTLQVPMQYCSLLHRTFLPSPVTFQWETEPDLPVSVRESPVEAWVEILASGQTTRREHSPAHPQKIGLKFYWTRLYPSEQDPVKTTHQEASLSLLSLFIRGQTEWKPQSQKTKKNWSHGPQPCLTQWYYEPCHVGPPKTKWVMLESSENTWSTGEGNGKPLLYSCLEDPMNSRKKKDVTLKDELPRLVVVIYMHTYDRMISVFRANYSISQ